MEAGRERLSRLRGAGVGAGAGRQRAMGRERRLGLSVGRPLPARADRRIDRRARAGRGDGPGPGSRAGRRADLRPRGICATPRRSVCSSTAGGARGCRRAASSKRAATPREAPGRRSRRSRCRCGGTGTIGIPGAAGRSHCRSQPRRPTRRSWRWTASRMREYFDRAGWASPRLRWYVDYCCRDDYGCTLDTTSAWAAWHYFCSRPAGVEYLTWPEGNGRIVRHLLDRLAGRRPHRHAGLPRTADRGRTARGLGGRRRADRSRGGRDGRRRRGRRAGHSRRDDRALPGAPVHLRPAPLHRAPRHRRIPAGRQRGVHLQSVDGRET